MSQLVYTYINGEINRDPQLICYTRLNRWLQPTRLLCSDKMADFEVVRNKRGKADTWRFFGLEKQKLDEKIEERTAVCYKCNNKVKYSGRTTNLATHMRRHHPADLAALAKESHNI